MSSCVHWLIAVLLTLLYHSIVLKRMKTPEFGTLKSYSELLVHSNSNSRTLRKPSMRFSGTNTSEKNSLHLEGLQLYRSHVHHYVPAVALHDFSAWDLRSACRIIVSPTIFYCRMSTFELEEEAMLRKRKMAWINMGMVVNCCCDGPYWTLDSDLIYCCCGGLFNKFTNIFSIMFVLWCLSYNIWIKKCRNATT